MTAIAYRPAELGTPDDPGPDRHFVIDGWVGSYRDAFTAGLIQVEDWYGIMIPQLGKVLAKPEVRVTVAHFAPAAVALQRLAAAASDLSASRPFAVGVGVQTPPGAMVDLLGFIVADPEDSPPLVYYAFAKEHYRRGGHGRLFAGAGVGRGLFAAAGIDPGRPFNYVCSTPMCRILARKIPLARWQPLLGRFPKSERRSRRL